MFINNIVFDLLAAVNILRVMNSPVAIIVYVSVLHPSFHATATYWRKVTSWLRQAIPL